MSSPVVWADRLFLTVFDAGQLAVHCYARKDGHRIWKQGVPSEKLEEFHATEGSPAASSCVARVSRLKVGGSQEGTRYPVACRGVGKSGDLFPYCSPSQPQQFV